MELYDGMKVSGKIEGKDVENGVISTKGCHDYYFCQDIKSGDRSDDLKGFKKSWSFHITPSGYSSDVTDLKPLSRTIEDVQEGDFLIDTRYDKRLEVLGICGKIIHLSYNDNCDSYNRSSTIKDLKQDGYEIEIPEPEEETVTITINGKDTIISKKSAEALNLI